MTDMMRAAAAVVAVAMNILERTIRAALRPPPDVKPWQWMELFCRHDNESSRRGQKWTTDTARFVREICEEVSNNVRRQISIRCSAQSAKTLTIVQCVLWIIENDPGPLMWVMAAKDEAATFMQQRLLPAMKMCAPVAAKLPTNRRDNKAMEINFDTMSFNLRGANSKSKLQSKPVRWLILDEVRNYPKGALDTVLKRIRTFWNARVIIISTPDLKDDAVDLAFLAGDQRHYHVPCPHCGHKQELDCDPTSSSVSKLGRFRWDVNDITRPNGGWDFDVLAPTIRYECAACNAAIKDTPSTRQALVDGGEWVKYNPTAPQDKVSFTWSAFLPDWVRWRDNVEEHLRSLIALEKGDVSPRKTFVTETLGVPWKDSLGDIKNWDFLNDRKQAYQLARNLPLGTTWEWIEEKDRYMAVDVQGKGGRHFRWVARAFSAGESGTNSRLIDYGTLWSWPEVLAKAEELGISLDNICVDFAHYTSEVYTYVIESDYRIKPIRGDKAANFIIEGLRVIWKWTEIDPAQGGKLQGRVEIIRALLFSSSGAKDKLASYMLGITGFGRWEISQEVDEEYCSQVSAEERNEEGKWVPVRVDNHFFDCEQMLVICAMASGLIYAPEKIDKKQPELFPIAHAVGPQNVFLPNGEQETEYYLKGQP